MEENKETMVDEKAVSEELTEETKEAAENSEVTDSAEETVEVAEEKTVNAEETEAEKLEKAKKALFSKKAIGYIFIKFIRIGSLVFFFANN